MICLISDLHKTPVFVIAMAFYPWLLKLYFRLSSAYIFNLSFNLGCRALMEAYFILYALRWQTSFFSPAYLGICISASTDFAQFFTYCLRSKAASLFTEKIDIWVSRSVRYMLVY